MTHYRPDILASGLKGIFCGINPAESAAAANSNFSNPSNRFWTVLFRAGITDVHLRSEDERRLLDYGYGITAAVGRPTHQASEISLGEFKRARPYFERKMRRYAPRAIGFLGKRAFCAMMNITDIPWGRQNEEFAGAVAWILPNPSGRNRSFALEDLVKAYSEFNRAF